MKEIAITYANLISVKPRIALVSAAIEKSIKWKSWFDSQTIIETEHRTPKKTKTNCKFISVQKVNAMDPQLRHGNVQKNRGRTKERLK